MKQVLLSAFILAWLSLSNSVAHAETMVVPDRYYSNNGKMLCEEDKDGSGEKCYVSDSYIKIYGGKIDSRHLEKYNKLALEFVKESSRQSRLMRSMTEQGYLRNLKKHYARGNLCDFDGTLSCKLAQINKQLAALQVLSEDERPTRWWSNVENNFTFQHIRTPFQQDRFGPYGKKASRQLNKLAQAFEFECRRQVITKTHRKNLNLLKLVLKASSVMVGNMPASARTELIEQWRNRCSKDSERSQEATIRFLLSGIARGINNYEYEATHLRGGKNAWLCGGVHLRIPLVKMDECGTLQYWAMEGVHINITKMFSGTVRTMRGFRK